MLVDVGLAQAARQGRTPGPRNTEVCNYLSLSMGMRVPVLRLRGPAQLSLHGVPSQAVTLLAEQYLHAGGARRVATAAACFLTGQACALAS